VVTNQQHGNTHETTMAACQYATHRRWRHIGWLRRRRGREGVRISRKIVPARPHRRIAQRHHGRAWRDVVTAVKSFALSRDDVTGWRTDIDVRLAPFVSISYDREIDEGQSLLKHRTTLPRCRAQQRQRAAPASRRIAAPPRSPTACALRAVPIPRACEKKKKKKKKSKKWRKIFAATPLHASAPRATYGAYRTRARIFCMRCTALCSAYLCAIRMLRCRCCSPRLALPHALQSSFSCAVAHKARFCLFAVVALSA